MILLIVCLVSLLISIPGFINKAGDSFFKGLIPGYNLYLFFLLLEFSPILLGLLGLGLIFLPDRIFVATLLFILLPFMVSEAYGKGKFFGFLTLLFPFIMYPLLAYFLGTYAYDVTEEKANFLRKNTILFILIIFCTIYVYNNYTQFVQPNKLIDTTSEHYVNNIYMSDGRIYNNYLNDYQKKMYMLIFDLAKKGKNEKVSLDWTEYGCKTPEDCADNIFIGYYALIVDHPELLSFASCSARYTSNSLVLSVQMAKSNLFSLKLGEMKIIRDIDKIKKETKKMSELEKIKYVYEWIGDNNTYDDLFTFASKNQSIYNVFVHNNAVCAGFAKASQVIFQNIGIKSYGILGDSTGPHMWNVVEHEGKYYYFDSTVAASIRNKESEHYYKGLIQEEMNFYLPTYPEWYPPIETNSGIYQKEVTS